MKIKGITKDLKPVYAWDLTDTYTAPADGIFCPLHWEIDKKLIELIPVKRINHFFRYKSAADVSDYIRAEYEYKGNETQEHYQIKTRLAKKMILDGWTVDVEKPISNGKSWQIADVYAEDNKNTKQILEIQLSPVSVESIAKRTNFYLEQNKVYTINWYFIDGENESAAKWVLDNIGHYYRIEKHVSEKEVFAYEL